MPSRFKYTVLISSLIVILSGVWLAGAKEHEYVPFKPIENPFEIEMPVDSPPGKDNSFKLEEPENIKEEVEYDPETKRFTITKKIGDRPIGKPEFLSFEEYVKREAEKKEHRYWEDKLSTSSMLKRKGKSPLVTYDEEDEGLLNIGGDFIQITPNGSIDITLGGNYQKVDNPILTERLRRQGGFNFDMNIQANVVGNIGNLMKLNFNYNTKATFDFENQMKLAYNGKEDQIIRKIEAGNVSLPLRNSLITGSQNLFGIKTELQFGRLTVTSLISQQKSKNENIQIQGGAQTRTFRVEADNYDFNRHFFLAHFFRDRYEDALKNAPVITSPYNITNVEVWITNRTRRQENARDILAFMDLGEHDSIYNTAKINPLNTVNPSNNSNDLYQDVNVAEVRNTNTSINHLKNFKGYDQVLDFEKTNAIKLDPNQYTVHPQLGYISLNQTPNPDEVLAVAFEYTYRGEVYRVGQFAQDVAPGDNNENVLILKMLKSTNLNPRLPMWNLMMKNIYSLNAYQVNPKDFFLDIYYQDPGGGEKRYIPAGPDSVKGVPLIRVLNLDKVNNRRDPIPDGVFDFIPGVTIEAGKGRLIFPVLEPFGDHLRDKFGSDAQSQILASRYVYDQLYDSTQVIAQQFPEFNRFIIQGNYKSSVSSEISLNKLNIPEGSVKVTAGGRVLQEGSDYTVDYLLGRVKIINTGIMESGIPINVSFESTDLFGIQTKTLFGTRLDYWINDNFTLGATFLKLSERPLTQKVNFGNEPISNGMYGFDVNYQKESEFITRIIDKLPLIETKEKSTVTASAEYARLVPGHPKIIGKSGNTYIDNFEGTRSLFDLRMPINAWKLASTPQNSKDANGNVLFPEATMHNNKDYGKNRALLSWYRIDNLFTRNNSATPQHIKNNPAQQDSVYVRQILEQEVFPNKQNALGQQVILPTLDLAFYPRERGPYNFDYDNIDPANGSLLNPRSRWGGIMQAINSSDFQAANVEYIEFWILDPFLDNPNNSGDLYINLGNISEDILKDGRRAWENGLPESANDTTNIDTTNWGRVPQGQPIVNAFENDDAARKRQDVGYDGLSDDDERTHFKGFLDTVQGRVPNNVYQNLLEDPSSDNYHYFRGEDYDAQRLPILARYKKFSNPDGNSPTTQNSPAPYPTSATNLPEDEDINGDNTLSESEDYFQYKVRLTPDMEVGENFVTDKIEGTNNSQFYRWYQFQIPIEAWESKTGNIQDFKSIRFMRMFLTNFRQRVILRFARIGLVRNQWRRYQKSLLSPGDFQSPTHDNSENFRFNLSVVNIEENSERQPVKYVTPPGIVREQSLSSLGNSVVLQNEQSLAMEVCGLEDGDSRAAFKNIFLDMRSFKRLNLFVHAEEVLDETPLRDGDLTAFIRIGSDYVNNFYEYEIPLKLTNHYDNDPNRIWPQENIIDILLDSLALVKQRRNFANASFVKPYSMWDSKGNRITVVGSPDLSRIKTIMMGVRNPKATGVGNDDGMDKCGIVWFNELRLTDFDEKGGSAALARVDVQMADLGNVAVSGNMHTAGFGGIEEQISNRFRDDLYQFDVSSSLQLGKLFPQKAGISIPMFAGITKSESNPQFDPYNSDLKMDEVYEVYKGDNDRMDSVKNTVQTTNTVKSFNLSNVRKTSNKPKKRIYDIENVNVTYSYTETEKTDPIIESDKIKVHRGIVGYNYSNNPKNYRPFQKLINPKWAYLKFLRDFNFSLLPSNISLQTEMNRQFGELQLRTIGDDQFNVDPTFNKYFTWDRTAAFRYNISRSLSADFSAATNARIDEPLGRIDEPEERKAVWDSIMSFGRTTNYQHRLNASYKLPFDKFPITNWINVDLKYGSDYSWITAPLSVTDWGNTIKNSRRFQINGTANTRTLYSNFQKLGNQIEKIFEGDPKKKQADKGAKNEKDKKKKNEKSFAGKAFERVITAIRSLSANYTNDRGTTVPGFIPKPDFIGQSFSDNLGGPAPGYDFLFGHQPDTSWLTEKAALGWFTEDYELNYQFLQTKTEDMNIRASVEPIKSLRIDITFRRSYTETYNEFFRNIDSAGVNFQHQSPQRMGNFNSTFIMWNTMFDSKDANGISNTFKQFEKNRVIISERLGEERGNTNPHDSIPDYVVGYGPVSQNVLLPAFLSAYTGKSANEYPVNQPFNKLPLPNWRISYNGLSRLPLFKEVFSNFSITHGYTSTYTINRFSSSQIYVQDPDSLNPLTSDFYPVLEIGQVNLTEQLSPLLGVDMQFKNSMNMNFSYTMSRSLNMSFLNYQLTEARTKEIRFGFGYKIRGLKLPGNMRIAGSNRLKNDLNIKLDFILRDMENRIHRLDQNISEPISGTYSLSVLPSADYRVNRNIDLRLFIDWRKTVPAVSTSFPITSVNGGITFRYTLTP